MQDNEAYNLVLRRVDKINNPSIQEIQTSRGPRYLLKGFGSDGTPMNKFISAEKYQQLMSKEQQFKLG